MAGVVCQHNPFPSLHSLVTISPGVHLSCQKDQRDQRYRTPHEAIFRDRVEILLVGRGITQSPDPLREVQKYQSCGWIS